MWRELPGSPDFKGGLNGAGRLVRQFQAGLNEGWSEAAAQGYAMGDVISWEGHALKLLDINPRNREGYDEVEITWAVAETQFANLSRDGKPHADGDEQWSLELGFDMVRAAEAYTYDGNLLSENTSGYKPDEPIPQPSIYLVWRKWLDKNDAGPADLPVTLPNTQAKALDALGTYVPGGTGTYETGGPRIGYVLSTSGIGPQLLCVSIDLQEDGNLVCRVAKYKWGRKNWNRSTQKVFGET